MQLNARVKRLETRIRAGGRCPECRGQGKPGYEFDFGCRTTGPQGGCRLCGKISRLQYEYRPIDQDLLDAL